MVKLYHCVSARSFRPLWTLEELQLPYELVMLPFPPRVHQREFLSVNPLGTIPAFTDGNIWMTESAAISAYLAARHDPGGLAVGVNEDDYGPYLNWLHFGEATLTFPQTLVLRYGRFEPEERRIPQVVADYSKWFLARLRAIDRVVSSQRYLCAERFTVADISVGYALMLAGDTGLDQEFPDAVRRYRLELTERPAYLRALAAQERASIAQGVSPVPVALGSAAS
jgi:glutathione S-transferase